MNILILNSWYYPNLMGGAEHSVLLLAENLGRRGHRVGVFTIDSEKREIKKETIHGVRVYRGFGGKYDIRRSYRPNKTVIESLWNKWLEIRNYSLISELSEVYSSFKPDIVHVNCIAGMSMSAIKYFQLKKIPIVYTLRDYFLDSPKNIVENPKWNKPFYKVVLSGYRWYTRRMSANVDACTAPSSFTLNYYLSNGYFVNSKIRKKVVNSVKISIPDTGNYIKEKLSHSKRNFMYAGSLVEAKGVIPMLTAFMKTDIECEFYICGTGNLLSYVLQCSNRDPRIKVLGKLKPNELEQIYRKSDIMLVPSLWAEPFGRVVIEAAKYGLYVIGSNNGGIPETINQLQCGEVCKDVADAELLSQCIINAFYADFSMVHQHILKNIDSYSIDHQIDSFEEIYNTIKNV